METTWLAALGLLLAGWSVLDGANLGLGMSLRRIGRSGPQRRLLLTALGPFLLGGEVWLVASAGLLIGAFPALEKDLLSAYYPLIVGLVVAWVLRDIGVWFRSRRPSKAWQGGWETVVVVASTVMAFAWGLLLGNVVQGVPAGGRPGVETLVGPYSLLWGAVVVAVFTLHGAVFAALRLPRGRRVRAAGTVRRAAAFALALLAAVGVLTPAFSVDLARRLPAAVMGVAAVVAVTLALRLFERGREGRAYVCSAVAAAAPLLTAGLASAPRLRDGLASAGSLDLLATVVVPAIPVLIAAQAWMWWTFRHRVGPRSAVFF
ncbi:cytochrome d ubiquinol oxidase subunit II [Jiangella ureilytica]|uniref:Cytochrome d ubiquinol oxidase subunit II n=1 Tax=Jiangella ureilytica TaxID=2530374 RepID=A0A4R4RAK6_9ACTN|nr:cytochrome d ubiquinol oxidase subunit II [Jiangella ureilytica]TDC46037.1 cytochrome d ubiquinol oxidase subunit II [Jiangella ureilytica]